MSAAQPPVVSRRSRRRSWPARGSRSRGSRPKSTAAGFPSSGSSATCCGWKPTFRRRPRPAGRLRPLPGQGRGGLAGTADGVVDNDRWAGTIPLARNTRYLYTVRAWRDPFALVAARARQEARRRAADHAGARRRHGAGRPRPRGRLPVMTTGWPCAHSRSSNRDARTRVPDRPLARRGRADPHGAGRTAGGPLRLRSRARGRRGPDCRRLRGVVRVLPRSQSDDPARHGTFDDVIRKLPYVRDMGFDVLYFPPVHPIGRANRKGRNNSLKAQPARSGLALRDRCRRGRARCAPPGARLVRGLRAADRGCGRARAGDRARFRDPMLTGPSLDPRAPGVVRLARRRHDPLRRESTQEVRGHRQRVVLSRGRPCRRYGWHFATWSCSG